MAGTLEVPAISGSAVRIQLQLEVRPKLAGAVVEALRPQLERTWRALLAGYEFTVVATPSVESPLDRAEGQVDVVAKDPAALIPLSSEQRILLHNESLPPLVDPIVPMGPISRRQQAVAILIAMITLLNTLLLVLK